MRWPPPPEWPHAELSRRVMSPPHRWHIQQRGKGPLVLLLHGAGGSTHSFRSLIPHLAKRFEVIAIDLPGQGFTKLGARHRCGLDAMSADIESLCVHEGWSPDSIIGHSAGGAIALNLSKTLMSPRGHPPRIVGINPALDTFDGIAGLMFPAMAKLLAAIPFTATAFSVAAARTRRIETLIGSTGSKLDEQGIDFYRQLVADRDHVDATLLMMAQWSLDHLIGSLPAMLAETLFITGDQDGTVPPAVARGAAGRIPNARLVELGGKGHLVHEEVPDIVADHILRFLSD
ncbi:alpha/beta fold hydrolase BchO [Roseobacter sp. EG26]|uniref:alpha/beta fold hydrolase BchO n=1 Tax=Roseobacter sp. EG26 TaxID=3412477 RepID=UPI003CE4D906